MPADGASGVAAGLLGWGWGKLAAVASGAGVAAGLAAFVVMTASKPQRPGEWPAALASTLAFSLFGGAASIRYFELHHWIYDPIGCVGLLGFVFACGLPGWVLVRAGFRYLGKHDDKDLAELLNQVKKDVVL